MESAAAKMHPDDIAALLEWYAAAGIDQIVDDAPRDRFAETAADAAMRRGRDQAPQAAIPATGQGQSPAARPREPERSMPAPMARVTVPDDRVVADARERASSAQTLDDLRAALEAFEGCNLRLSAKSLVFGSGPETAELMMIGEAPGRDEDIAGLPFVGKSGQLLDRMLAAIGIARASVRVTNTVPWRPPGNRPPTPVETEMCLPFLTRQIELVRPKMIVCLGAPATKALLNADGILRIRGQWMRYSFGGAPDETIPAMPMLHPAYLLRQPAQKKLAWRDLLALKEKMAETASVIV